MTRASLITLAALSAVSLVAVGGREAAPAGPPWISLELPANPLDPATRDAAFLIHAYHHGDPAGLPINGTAEGIVNGERRSLPLEFARTSRPSIYALDQVWPNEGHWVLTINIGEHGTAALFVELGANGGLKSGDYYGHATKSISLRSVQVVRGGVGKERIESALATLASTDD